VCLTKDGITMDRYDVRVVNEDIEIAVP